MSTLRKVMYHRPRDEEDEPPPPPSLLHWDRGVCVCVRSVSTDVVTSL